GGISLINSVTATPRAERSTPTTKTGRTQTDGIHGTFPKLGFTTPSDLDSDLDGVPDAVEIKNGWNKNDASDGADTDGTGISRSTQFQILSQISNPDQNGDGVVDGRDDSDGDGIPNAVEEANGTSAWLPDTDGNGIPDGQEDNNGNGVPDVIDW